MERDRVSGTWSSVCSVMETRAGAEARERGVPGQELFVVIWVCFCFCFFKW